MLFAIILVAEFMVGWFAGVSIKSFTKTGSPLFLIAACVGVAEIFTLAYAGGQVI